MQILRAIINNETFSLTLADEKSGTEDAVFVNAAWGAAKLDDKIVAFFSMYRGIPTHSKGWKTAKFVFTLGRKEGFGVAVDEIAVPKEKIKRLCFFASTDVGDILVSYQPALAIDARPFTMQVVNKKRLKIGLRHLATSCLHELWGYQDEAASHKSADNEAPERDDV